MGTAEMEAGDKLLQELNGGALARPLGQEKAATMGRLGKCSYTHEAMIDLIIQHPELDQNHIAAHFGYTPGWISNILASDAFQSKMAARREEVIDPELKATIEERFRALTIQSLKVLQAKLNQPSVSDTVALRAAELGAKALGIGGNAPPAVTEKSADRLMRLAERLTDLIPKQPEKIVHQGEVLNVETKAA